MSLDNPKDKVILITGSSRGIGLETVRALVKKGYRVYATVKDLNTPSSLFDLSKEYNNLIIRKLDVTKTKDITSVIKEIIKTEKKIDILINNAAYILFGPVETVSLKQARHQFEVNFFGTINLIQKVLPYMRKKKEGHIICLGSTSGVESSPMYGLYAASKFALEALVYSLAANLLPWNIRVSIIELSATSTDICEKSLQFGDRFKNTKDPYLSYTKNAFDFLNNIIKNGVPAENISNCILETIENKSVFLRSMATKRAKSIFEETLSDPLGEKWLEVAKTEMNWRADHAS